MQDPGQVAVWIRTQPVDADLLNVVITVRDNGIGMSQETMDQIFRPFTQADGSIRRKFGGTGLGLTISDRLIKMMGGHISVMSDPGEGTIFEVKLQMRCGSDPAIAQTALQELEDCRLLVHAENSDIADNLARYARAAGAKVALAEDPSINIQSFNADLRVIQRTDIAEAQQILHQGAAIPTLHLTHHGRNLPDPQPGLITLPITSLLPGDITEALNTLRAEKSQQSAQGEAMPDNRILLVEDDEMTREITLRMLKQLGIAADAVINGQEGLELWRSGQYTLLLSDCHMPIMDGFQMAARIRDEESQRNLPKTPIIAVSADMTMEVERLCQDCEIDEYVPKPLTPAKLKTLLHTHIPHQIEPTHCN